MGPTGVLIYEGAMAALTLFRTLMVENREPTLEELQTLEDRNVALISDLRKRVEARTD